MNDISAPISYHPTKTKDHILIEITVVASIGVNNCEDPTELENFKKSLVERLRTTGALIEDVHVNTIKQSPYCGSVREKLFMNEQDRESNKQKEG